MSRIEAHPMETLAAEMDFFLDGAWGKPNHGFISTREEHVWCNWCQCEIRPQLFAVRQHRRVCTTDPRVAGIADWCGCDADKRVHPHNPNRKIHEGVPCPPERVPYA